MREVRFKKTRRKELKLEVWGEMSEVRGEMRGVRFNIIESRVECRSVSTHEGGWDLEISLREELKVEV